MSLIRRSRRDKKTCPTCHAPHPLSQAEMRDEILATLACLSIQSWTVSLDGESGEVKVVINAYAAGGPVQ